jgi:hypothetical protein
MPGIRDTLFPPPRLSDRARPNAGEAARRIHRICTAATWSSYKPATRALSALLALLWPLIGAVGALPWVRQNGAAIRALSGKGLLRQWWEMTGLAARHRIAPRYYSMFEFYRDERRAMAGDYMTRLETKQVAYRLLRPDWTAPGTPIKNKVAFAGYCAEHGLPAVPLLAAFEKGQRLPGIGPEVLPGTDIFAKRVFGKGGARAERWNWIGNGRYRSMSGEERDADGLLAFIARLSEREAYVVQPALSNHAELEKLSAGALCTVRMVTLRNETGGHEVTNASFRMSVRPEAAVDNIHAGGIAAPVDLATGRLGPASDLGLGPRLQWHDAHPLTGGTIAGRILPHWPEAMALAARAHDVFAEYAVIGWDVAILDEGAVLIEGNKGPDVDLIQRPLRGPMGSGRFGALLAWNLEQSRFWRESQGMR